MPNKFDIESGIHGWVKAKLKEANDRAIYQYLRSLNPAQIAEFSSQLRNLVERQEITIGKHTYINQYFAVPIIVQSEQSPEAYSSDWLDTTALLKSFHKHGLLGRRDGVALLETIVGHGYMERDSLSSIYKQAESLFMTSVSGGHFLKCSATSPVMPIQLGDQHLTLCYIVGVAYWKKGAAEPKIMSRNAEDAADWQNHARTMISFGLAQHGEQAPAIKIGMPQPLFEAFEEGHMALVNQVIGNLVMEVSELGEKAKVSFTVSADGWLAMRHNLRVEISGHKDLVDPTYFDIKVDEVTGLSTKDIVSRLERTLAEMDVLNEGVSCINTDSRGSPGANLH